ncbi:MAG: DNA-directed RNA polymerase I subunit RPA43 [Streblomastix strix]|uniref:DNA-directed RNA polymerase I subunit RPA43 n=1 Tax=Streblomastix strix TaxID=222440 RepID=A0A5J4VSY5_9EUKA|nr:MAG: DNA-directed RNA polymerase I subunit RPA43 [Streblomastix strix]
MSLFKEIKTVVDVWLPPSSLRDLDRYMREYLDKFLLRYNQKLDGIVLTYSGEKIKSRLASIPDDVGILGFVINVKFMVFSPVCDQKITGVVQSISDTHINVIVLGILNVIINAEDMPSYFHRRDAFVLKNSQPSDTIQLQADGNPRLIVVNSKVNVQIKDIIQRDNVPVLIGKINSTE